MLVLDWPADDVFAEGVPLLGGPAREWRADGRSKKLLGRYCYGYGL